MKKLICAIRDSKVEAFMTPMFFRSKGEAIRSFHDAVNDSNMEFKKHAEDFVMFVLGEYDEQLGQIDACVAEPLIKAIDLVKEDE